MSNMKELQIKLVNRNHERLEHVRAARLVIEAMQIIAPTFGLKCPQCFRYVLFCGYCGDFACPDCDCHGDKYLEKVWQED